MKGNFFTIRAIAETGMLIALAVIIQIVGKYTFSTFAKFVFAEGWTPYLASIPLLYLMFRRGAVIVVIASIITEGISFLIANGNFIIVGSPTAFIIDYVLGRVISILIGGIVMKLLYNKLHKKNNLFIVIVVSVWFTIATLAGIWSGIVFYGEYAEWSNAWIYSMTYNISSYSIAFIILMIAIIATNKTHKELLYPIKEKHVY